MKNLILTTFLLFIWTLTFGQEQTIGLLSYKKYAAYDGYTLIYPREQSTVFLLNNCGEIVHQWVDDDKFVPNNAVYLLDNGYLVKCKKHNNGLIGTGNGEYFVEIVTWDNQLVWSYELNTAEERLHHDVEVLPNGNILMIAWERKSKEEALANGRSESTLESGVLFPDYIFEVNPETNDKVWEWHVWDHMIQDLDSTKLNYGKVGEHPELIDINYVENTGGLDWDWLHVNAVDYHEGLDQIMICVPYFNELWIIDHSTTTEEAATHSGGNYGRGGDLLYRIGNPQSYDRGTPDDQMLYFPHDTHWANEFIDEDHPNYDNILIFNNRTPGRISKMEIFENPWDITTAEYPMVDGLFQPHSFEKSITHPMPTSFYSVGLSSVQVLPNGNILGCSGAQGYLLELTPDNEIVWEYKVPIRYGNYMSQGTVINDLENLTFRAFRYPTEYGAFVGRDLSSKGFVELNPNEEYCEILTSTNEAEDFAVRVFPNPTTELLHLQWLDNVITSIKIVDMKGQEIYHKKASGNSETIKVDHLPNGSYILVLNNRKKILFVVER